MKKLFTLLILGVFVLTMPLMLTGCSRNSNTLIVATSLTWPPFGSMASNGSPVGIDILIAQHLAAEMGKSLRINNGDFASVIAAMNTGGAHLGISSLSVTPERAQSMMFSIPYHITGLALVTNSPVGTSNFDGMSVEQVKANMTGVSVGTGGAAGVAALFVQDNGGIVNAVGTGTAINQLATNSAAPFNYVLLDVSVVPQMTANFPNLRIVDTPLLTITEIAIALPLGNQAMLDQVNAILTEMKADGTLDAFFAQFDIRMDMSVPA